MDNTDPRRQADRIKTRLERLQRLSGSEHGSVDEKVRTALTHVWETGTQPATIKLRPRFVRLGTPTAGDLGERDCMATPPHPPLALLYRAPHGVPLPVALVMLFVLQCQERKERQRWRLPLVSSDDGEVGLSDLIAVTTKRRTTESKQRTTAKYRRPRGEARADRVRSALKRLADPKVEFLTLPRQGVGRGGFSDLVVNQETGPRRFGEAVPYRLPQHNESVIEIPASFFLKGWVHALDGREIATWLLFRDLLRQRGAGGPDGLGLYVTSEDRIAAYRLPKTVWDSHAMLIRFGLMKLVWRMPERRSDGTVIGRRTGEVEYLGYDRFGFTDDGLAQPAVEAVAGVLEQPLAEITL